MKLVFCVLVSAIIVQLHNCWVKGNPAPSSNNQFDDSWHQKNCGEQYKEAKEDMLKNPYQIPFKVSFDNLRVCITMKRYGSSDEAANCSKVPITKQFPCLINRHHYELKEVEKLHRKIFGLKTYDLYRDKGIEEYDYDDYYYNNNDNEYETIYRKKK